MAGRECMYLCLCNGFTDKAAQAAISAGCRTIEDLFRHLDGEPICCTCLSMIEQLIDSCGATPDPAAAAV